MKMRHNLFAIMALAFASSASAFFDPRGFNVDGNVETHPASTFSTAVQSSSHHLQSTSHPTPSHSTLLPPLSHTSSSHSTSPATHVPSSPHVPPSVPPPPHYTHFACGTNITHASPHFLSTIHSLHVSNLLESRHAHGPLAPRIVAAAAAADPSSPTSPSPRSPSSTPLSVDLYMHVVTTAAHSNMITKSQMAQQFAALNAAYNPFNIHFTLRNTSYTTNDTWAIGASDTDDTSMKSALRQGTYASLNLYFQSDLSGGLLGRCTLPTSIGPGATPASYVADGCNIALGTVPGGPYYGYNEGKTAVHETGHWLGLLHTFEGYSCSGNGDYVADTPMESQSTDGCPTNPWKNSCEGVRPGVDPIHNYMDYSVDACYTRFTPLQMQRMQTLWPIYRQGN